VSVGQHFTPPSVADLLVELALAEYSGGSAPRVLDPACGDGALLAAVRRRIPDAILHGFDIDPEAAGTALQRVPGAKIVVADALTAVDDKYDLVVMNPPYVGEKGNKSLFDEVRGLGPLWAGRCAPRMDLLYFFLHLGLDVLRPGGVMAALTTAYWPSATSAAVLRADLSARSWVARWVRFGGRSLFATAPGQHNLAVVAVRGEGRQGWSWCDAHFDGERATSGPWEEVNSAYPPGPWQPFVSAADAAWLRTLDWSVKFGDVALDRQGVVSGCDRLDGRPVFMFTPEEVAALGWLRDPAVSVFLEPILRGSDLRDSEPACGRYLLYLDGSVEPPEALLSHLAFARERLEARRETRLGTRPWWALHWPRDRDAMRAPKLVTARRGPKPRFYLDLDGRVVSSDCTWILPRGVPIESLQRALHTPEVERLLQVTGKWKGGLCEFYSEPLRRLRLPLPDGHQIVNEAWCS
jgi:adenine-specific DNA-methyltransferase